MTHTLRKLAWELVGMVIVLSIFGVFLTPAFYVIWKIGGGPLADVYRSSDDWLTSGMVYIGGLAATVGLLSVAIIVAHRVWKFINDRLPDGWKIMREPWNDD